MNNTELKQMLELLDGNQKFYVAKQGRGEVPASPAVMVVDDEGNRLRWGFLSETLADGEHFAICFLPELNLLKLSSKRFSQLPAGHREKNEKLEAQWKNVQFGTGDYDEFVKTVRGAVDQGFELHPGLLAYVAQRKAQL